VVTEAKRERLLEATFSHLFSKWIFGWGYSSLVELLPGMCKVLDSIPAKKKKKKSSQHCTEVMTNYTNIFNTSFSLSSFFFASMQLQILGNKLL
jgi:hypothetical protein